jgi:hypothetical protein
MVAFCRQNAKLEEENEGFWLKEARLWPELLKVTAAMRIIVGLVTSSSWA